MIIQLTELPENMVGFRATGEVTERDFKTLILPKVAEFIRKHNKLNYMLVLDTSLKNFTAGAWIQDVIMGAKHFLKWNRAAIVSDVQTIRSFTDLFGKVMPGEYKGFEHSQMQEAIDWVSEKSDRVTKRA